MRRPYNCDYPVDVVWHDNEFVQFDVGEMGYGSQPTRARNLPVFIHPHFRAHHVAKQAFPSARHNRDEIRPRLRIIVPRQTDGTAMVFVGIVWHHGAIRASGMANDVGRRGDACVAHGVFTSPRIQDMSHEGDACVAPTIGSTTITIPR